MKDFNENQQEKGTSLIKSMPQSAPNDTYLGNNFCKNDKKCTKNLNFLRKPRVFKVIAASGLALFMGIGAMCGVLIAPGNVAANMAAREEALAQQQEAAEAQEALINGTLDLDPENDPVVFTTDYGLEIKWHMANPLPTDPSDLSTTTVSSTTWAYFEAGGLEWIIIGYSNKTDTDAITTGNLNISGFWAKGYYDKPNYYNFTSTEGIWPWLESPDKTTPAGSAVYNDYMNKGKDVVYNLNANSITQKSVFPNAAATDELETNEVLCLLSGNYTTTTKFGKTNVYYSEAGVSSNLRTYINDNIYPLVKDLPIVPQPLTTAGSASTTEYLFPLGTTQRASTESFAVENYLDSNTKRAIGASWWLRSGRTSNARIAGRINSDGSVYDGSTSGFVTSDYGVRPAFVLKI